MMSAKDELVLTKIRNLKKALKVLVRINSKGESRKSRRVTLDIKRIVSGQVAGLYPGERGEVIRSVESEIREWSEENGYDYGEAMEQAIDTVCTFLGINKTE